MRNLNTAMRKQIGYFGWLYACYLAEKHPKSWKMFLKREDSLIILYTIHYHCQEMIDLYLEIVGRKQLNDYKRAGDSKRGAYEEIIEGMKEMAFDSGLRLLEYAEWMVD